MANTPTRSSFPTVIAFIGALLVFMILLAYQYQGNQAEEQAVERPSLVEHRAAATEKLNEVSVNPATGKVRLKIERAMELIVAENSK